MTDLICACHSVLVVPQLHNRLVEVLDCIRHVEVEQELLWLLGLHPFQDQLAQAFRVRLVG